MKKTEDNKLTVFIVNVKVNKHQRTQAVEELHDTDVAQVNTLPRPAREKEACVWQAPDYDALDVAKKTGIIGTSPKPVWYQAGSGSTAHIHLPPSYRGSCNWFDCGLGGLFGSGGSAVTRGRERGTRVWPGHVPSLRSRHSHSQPGQRRPSPRPGLRGRARWARDRDRGVRARGKPLPCAVRRRPARPRPQCVPSPAAVAKATAAEDSRAGLRPPANRTGARPSPDSLCSAAISGPGREAAPLRQKARAPEASGMVWDREANGRC
nr:uncharacterized protein LOC121822873 [Peromyscus maniculatus bairdii]